MSELKIQRNIKVYYAYLSLFQLIVGPILTLYLLGKGLSYTEIMVLESFFSVAVVVLEVPTGALGDLFGRRFSLFWAGIFMALGAITYIFGAKFWQFMIGEALFACGMSLKSGSDTAIVYDSLKNLGKEKIFATIQGKGEAFALGAQIIGSVLSGFIYSLNKELPLLISAVLMIFSAVASLFFYEIKTFEQEEKPGYFRQITISARFLLGHRRVRSIVIYSIFFFVFFRVGFWYYQPYFQDVGIDTQYFGIIFALFNIVATVSARFAGKFIERTRGKSMILLSVLMVSSFILLGLTRVPFGFNFICLQQVVRGVQVPVFMKYINKHIPSNQRATIISCSSLLKNLAVAAAFPVAGLFMDRIDAVRINLFTGLIMAVGTVFFYFFLNRRMERTDPSTCSAADGAGLG